MRRLLALALGALTHGPFRLRRYPRVKAALRRALHHRRFALR